MSIATQRETAGAATWLALAAAPSFALMALLTSVQDSGAPDMLCAAGHDGSLLGGMVPMYLLMSAFHLVPWLKLVSGRRGGRHLCMRRSGGPRYCRRSRSSKGTHHAPSQPALARRPRSSLSGEELQRNIGAECRLIPRRAVWRLSPRFYSDGNEWCS
jgi:hypothetical protein